MLCPQLQTMDLVENSLNGINRKEDGKIKIPRDPTFIYELQTGDEDLLRPLAYHTSVPGKSLRTSLIKVLNYWMDVPEDKIVAISEIVDNLHNVTLLIDDIQDDTCLRRGVPAAHSIYGIDNVANACFFHNLGIYDNVLELNHPMALRIYLDAYLELFRGQGLELYWRENAICPTEEEYEQMILKKTGGIFFLANSCMRLFARKHVDLERLLTAITLYFQINDDYLNLNSNVYFVNKGFCEDLTEGKFGYPIMHAVNSNPKIGQEIIEILKIRTTDVGRKNHCLSLIEKCGSFQYTRDRLSILESIIMKELEKLEVNPLFNEFLPKIMLKSCKPEVEQIHVV